MKKLTLSLDELRVDSFDTSSAAQPDRRGTVHGRQQIPHTAMTCGHSCWGTCDPSCGGTCAGSCGGTCDQATCYYSCGGSCDASCFSCGDTCTCWC